MVNLPAFLRPFKEAGALHSVLAPKRFIDEHVFLTKGGGLGIMFTVQGIDYETLTAETLESYTRRVSNAWRAFDERFRLYQYLLKQDRAPIAHRTDHTSAAVNRTVAARVEHLQASGLYTIQLVYAILIEPSKKPGKWRLSSKKVVDACTGDLTRNLETLVQHAEAFQRSVGSLIGSRIASKEQAFAFLRLLVNLDPETARSERLKHSSHVDYFLPSLPLACTEEGLRIGDAHLEVLSLREPPAATMPNVLREFLKIEANMILCTEFQRVANDLAVRTVRNAQTFFFHQQWISDPASLLSMAMSGGNKDKVRADKSKLSEVENLDGTLSRININGEYLGELSLTCILYGWKGKRALQTAATDARRIVGNLEGSLLPESFNALNAYLSIIPGNHAFNLRRGWMLSGNYADLAFLWAPGMGDPVNRHLAAEHLITLQTSDRTPFYFSLHENDHLGSLILGAPGAGKSVLANTLIDHSQKYGGRTFILDLGGSYRQICRKHGGAYLRVDARDFQINPFSAPGTPDNLQFLFTWIRALLTGAGYQPSVNDDKGVYEAVANLYRLGPEHRTLSDLAAGISPRLKPFLSAWIGGGRYGHLFDNVADTLTFADFQVLDFSGMETYPQVLEPLLLVLFHRISGVVTDPALARVPKQLFADETWRFLTHETARNYLLAAGKTWRKHNGGLGIVTQSLGDLRSAGILDLVNEVCPVKLLLASPGADLSEYQDTFKLSDRELELYADLIPKRQFLLKTEQRSKILNLDLDARALAEYANDPHTNARREAETAAHGYDAGMSILAGETN